MEESTQLVQSLAACGDARFNCKLQQVSSGLARQLSRAVKLKTHSLSFTKQYRNDTFFDYFPYIRSLLISLPVQQQLQVQHPVEGGYYLSELHITGTLEQFQQIVGSILYNTLGNPDLQLTNVHLNILNQKRLSLQQIYQTFYLQVAQSEDVYEEESDESGTQYWDVLDNVKRLSLNVQLDYSFPIIMANFQNLVALELSLCSDDHVMYRLPELQIQELTLRRAAISTHVLNLVSTQWQQIRRLSLECSQFNDTGLNLLRPNKIQAVRISVFETMPLQLFQKFSAQIQAATFIFQGLVECPAQSMEFHPDNVNHHILYAHCEQPHARQCQKENSLKGFNSKYCNGMREPFVSHFQSTEDTCDESTITCSSPRLHMQTTQLKLSYGSTESTPATSESSSSQEFEVGFQFSDIEEEVEQHQVMLQHVHANSSYAAKPSDNLKRVRSYSCRTKQVRELTRSFSQSRACANEQERKTFRSRAADQTVADDAQSYYQLCANRYFKQSVSEYNHQQCMRLCKMENEAANYISEVGDYYLNSVFKQNYVYYDQQKTKQREVVAENETYPYVRSDDFQRAVNLEIQNILLVTCELDALAFLKAAMVRIKRPFFVFTALIELVLTNVGLLNFTDLLCVSPQLRFVSLQHVEITCGSLQTLSHEPQIVRLEIIDSPFDYSQGLSQVMQIIQPSVESMVLKNIRGIDSLAQHKFPYLKTVKVEQQDAVCLQTVQNFLALNPQVIYARWIRIGCSVHQITSDMRIVEITK